MRRFPQIPRPLLAIGLVGTLVIAAGCSSSTQATTQTTSSISGMPGMSGGQMAPATSSPTTGMGSMPGMNMTGTVPGNGLLATAAELTFKPLTSTIPAGQTSSYQFQIVQANNNPVTTYQAELTKLLHFYMVRDDLTGFEHVHPTLDSTGTWMVNLAPGEAGNYRVYAQFTATPSNTPISLVLSQPLTVTGTATPAVPLPMMADTTQVDGYVLAVSGTPSAGKASQLSVTFTKTNQPVSDLQPYLNTYAHLTAFHAGDMGFAHLHPMGSVNGNHGGPKLSFDAVFEEAGQYRLFIQFQTGGMLHTAQVTLSVH